MVNTQLESRLPKWAQAKLQMLRNEVLSLKDRLAERDQFISESYEWTNVKVDGNGPLEPSRSLPPDSTVTFYLNGETERYGDTISVNLRRAGNSVDYVVVTSEGYTGLSIQPIAANRIHIKSLR